MDRAEQVVETGEVNLILSPNLPGWVGRANLIHLVPFEGQAWRFGRNFQVLKGLLASIIQGSAEVVDWVE